jgi:hypothetical protein
MVRMHLLPTLLPAILAVGVSAVATRAQSARLAAQKVYPSVVLVLVDDAGHQSTAQGSGFFVAPGMVVTNRHLVEGAAFVSVKTVKEDSVHSVTGVLAEDLDRDLVLLGVPGIAAPILPLGHSREVLIGDTILVVGNPLGVEGTFAQGIVNGVRWIGGAKLMQITAVLTPGLSGGPVVDTEGRVVGVSVGLREGDNYLGFALPAEYLTELMGKSGLPRPYPAPADSPLVGLQRMFQSLREGVEVSLESYARSGFNFSLKNLTTEPIGSVKFRVILYTRDTDEVIDFVDMVYGRSAFGGQDPEAVIPPGLAKRVSVTFRTQTWNLFTDYASGSGFTYGRHEIRILDWTVVR